MTLFLLCVFHISMTNSKMTYVSRMFTILIILYFTLKDKKVSIVKEGYIRNNENRLCINFTHVMIKGRR